MFQYSKVYKPFQYPWAVELSEKHEQLHWVEQEITLEEDVVDWKRNKLTKDEKEFITQVLRLFTQSDVAVGSYYYDKLIPLFRNNEIRNMLGSFAAREAIHQRAYALLNDSLGLSDKEYAAFLEYAEMKDKLEYMSKDCTTSKDLNTYDVAHSLAKAVFNEGVSLFASFAMLLNFQRRGLMKGMGKVVEWSVRDESCFKGDVEVLTEAGWQRFDQLNKELRVAQYCPSGSEISFVHPIKHIEQNFQGSLYHFKHPTQPVDITCTDKHELLISEDFAQHNLGVKVRADMFTPDSDKQFICAGRTITGANGLTLEDKLRIAFVFSPSFEIPALDEKKWYKVLIQGKKLVNQFETLSKITDSYVHVVKRTEHKNANFTIKVPANFTKDLDWVDLTKISYKWCQEFFQEIAFWNEQGTINAGDKCVIKLKTKAIIDKLQAIAAISYYRIDVTPGVKTNPQAKHLTITRNNVIPSFGADVTIIPYAGKVYCVTVPYGSIIVRQNGKVMVIGNCHVEGVSNLFKTVVKEHKDIVDDGFKKFIYEMAKETVRHEDVFIDAAFSNTAIEGLTANDTKLYIRYLTDRRLIQLGLKGIFKVKKNPLLWIEAILNAPSHDNFFEQRSTNYSISGLGGEWSYD